MENLNHIMPLSWSLVFILCVTICHTLADCPVKECTCYRPNGHSLRVIYCQDKGFSQLPEISKSDELFAELILSNNQQYVDKDCKTCNRITEIPPNAFSGLRVKRLDLSTNPIAKTYDASFNGLQTDLTELILEGNKKTSLPYRSIRLLKNLTKLEVMNFNAKYLDSSNTFNAFPNLHTLRLINLNLKFIRKNSFRRRLQNLKTLEIHGNTDLYILPVGALQKLPSLEVLKYTKNGLETLPVGAFRRLVNLRVLDLSNNWLTQLKKGCFKTIRKSLVYLALHRNNLQESNMQSLAETNWRKLEHLNLSSNAISSASRLFKNMKNLKTLMLVKNNIQEISSTDFSNLRSLEMIDLSNNALKTIQPLSFKNCKRLSKLSLQENKGSKLKLTRNSIKGMQMSLRELNLQQTVIDENEIWIMVRDLWNLEKLDLSGTGLTFIPFYTFQNFVNLQYLKLNDNKIQTLKVQNIKGLESTLQRIELQNNLIQTLSKCVFIRFTSLELFNLDNNPLNCDCRLRWLWDWTTSEKTFMSLMTALIRPECQTPKQFTGLYLTDISRENLKCSPETSIDICQDLQTRNTANKEEQPAIPPSSFGNYFQKIMG